MEETMKPHKRFLIGTALGGAVLSLALGLPGTAGAQAWPTQTVRVVVPFAAGGATDIIARMVAEKLSTRLGQNLIVENRGGASGIVGTQAVQNAKPDGHTLLLTGNGPHAVNVALFAKLPYDPLRDFAQISLTGVLPLVLNANPGTPVKSLDDFIRWARSHPDKATYASPGIGTPPHLSMELLAQAHGLKLTHVPYKGSAPAIADLIAGHVPVMFDNVFASIQNVRAGRIRSVAVGSLQRLDSLPEVPTFAESGMPGFQVATWTSLAAPAGTPAAIVNRLSAEVAAIFREPDVRERLQGQGAMPVTSTPAETARFVAEEIDKWRRVAEAAKVPRQDG
jgi:tripartite-type tricarboxylate transporter receptor subunit TctC